MGGHSSGGRCKPNRTRHEFGTAEGKPNLWEGWLYGIVRERMTSEDTGETPAGKGRPVAQDSLGQTSASGETAKVQVSTDEVKRSDEVKQVSA